MSTTATTIAITSAANAQAAAANAAAQEAKRKACMAYVRGYEHDRATVTEHGRGNDEREGGLEELAAGG